MPRPKLATDTHARGEAPEPADKSARLLNKRSEIGPGPVPSQVTFVGASDVCYPPWDRAPRMYVRTPRDPSGPESMPAGPERVVGMGTRGLGRTEFLQEFQAHWNY